MSNWQLSGVPFTAKVEHREHLISSIVYELLSSLSPLHWLVAIYNTNAWYELQKRGRKREPMEDLMQLQWETCKSNRLTPALAVTVAAKEDNQAQTCSATVQQLGRDTLANTSSSFIHSVSHRHTQTHSHRHQPETASRLDSTNSFSEWSYYPHMVITGQDNTELLSYAKDDLLFLFSKAERASHSLAASAASQSFTRPSSLDQSSICLHVLMAHSLAHYASAARDVNWMCTPALQMQIRLFIRQCRMFTAPTRGRLLNKTKIKNFTHSIQLLSKGLQRFQWERSDPISHWEKGSLSANSPRELSAEHHTKVKNLAATALKNGSTTSEGNLIRR